jgi:hypothetical protein
VNIEGALSHHDLEETLNNDFPLLYIHQENDVFFKSNIPSVYSFVNPVALWGESMTVRTANTCGFSIF